jgi:glycyl-tRNA synthetase
VSLAPVLGAEIGLDEADTRTLVRAAELSKSDLASSLVVEMTSLQGVVGRLYALRSGEEEPVADAILEHHLPRATGDSLPVTAPGRVLGLADRLDTLAGLFAVGVRPTATQDPFGLRRAAAAVITLLVDGDLDLELGRAIDLAAATLPVPLAADARGELLAFLAKRLEVQLRDDGTPADAVAAALAALAGRPARAARSASVLAERAAEPGWEVTLTAYARCARIVRASGGQGAAGETAPIEPGGSPAVRVPAEDSVRVSAEDAESPAERALAAEVENVSSALDRTDPKAVLTALDRLAPTIHTYFDHVLVMAEDPGTRAARLALVQRIAGLPVLVADLSRMEGF